MFRKMCQIFCLLLFCAAASTALAQHADESVAGSSEIYGRDLMTPQERDAYRQRVRNLRTEVERERFRQDHRDRMQNRAAQRGMPPEEILPSNRRSFQEAPSPGDGLPMRDDGLRRWSPEDPSIRSGLRQWPASPGAENSQGDGLRRLQDGRR